MKKILITIPLIFVMVLSFVPVFTVSADYTFNEAIDGYTEETAPRGPDAVDFSGSYFWFHTSLVDWSQIINCLYKRCTFYWAYLDLDNPAISTTEENGVFHWSWTGHPFYGFYQEYSAKSGNTDRSNFNQNMDFVYYCQDLYYNPSTGEVWSETGNTTFGVNPNATYPYAYKQQHLVLDGHDFDANALNVSVITNPTFSGSVNRSHTSGGISSTDDYFTLNVTNNGRTDIQWFFAIVESGYNVGYSAEFMTTPSGADITVHDRNIKYIYIARENCFLPVLYDNQAMKDQLPANDLFQFMGDNDNHYDAVNGSVNSTWHFLNSGVSSGDLRIKYDMLDLQANHSYDVVAYAVKNSIGSTSYLWDNGEMSVSPLLAANPFVNASAIEEVYRSSFSLQNPATYNPNSSIDGAIANNSGSDYTSLTGTIYGYTDPLTGSHFDQYNYTGDGWGMVAGANNITYSGSANSSKFNTLMSESNGLLRFFSNCFGFFPRDFQMVAYSGFLTLIIICVWKRVH